MGECSDDDDEIGFAINHIMKYGYLGQEIDWEAHVKDIDKTIDFE